MCTVQVALLLLVVWAIFGVSISALLASGMIAFLVGGAVSPKKEGQFYMLGGLAGALMLAGYAAWKVLLYHENV
jgi:hypothetical protein